MRILAMDPGDVQSAYVYLNDDYTIHSFGKVPNENLKEIMADIPADITVIEMIASYGMAVGKTVFETCVWIGRFSEFAETICFSPVKYIYRSEEKMNLCHSMKAKDANIRQALIDRFAQFDFKNGKGTKKNPDVFYGFSADMWAAMAVGVTYLDKEKEKFQA